jgi:hypothetical protein
MRGLKRPARAGVTTIRGVMNVTTRPPDARDPMSLMSRLLPLLVLAVAALPPLAHGAAPQAPRNDTLATCSWDQPGRNPFMGDVVAAVDRYRDIPMPVREKLKQRMRSRQYEDLVDIRRDEIKGKFEYAATIRDMHFGEGSVCRQVTRERWTDRMHERGLVYCEAEHCILVPTVCRNVSRIERKAPPVAAAPLQPPAVLLAPPLAVGGREAPAGAAPVAVDSAPPALPTPITSSFAEAVAGVSVPLFTPPGEPSFPDSDPPFGDGSSPPFDTGSGPGIGGGRGVPPWFPPGLSVQGGPDVVPTAARPGEVDGGVGDGLPIDPGSPPPVAPIPEPSTWASLLAGLSWLAWVVARQRRAATGAPKCATQKRS